MNNKSLVENLRKLGYIKSQKVYEAMIKVDRRDFVPEEVAEEAYYDTPLPIGYGQTISAPHMVAIMLELLDLEVGMNVLEIGTGSGYNAALMAVIVEESGRVVTIERIRELYERAREKLSSYKNVVCLLGDGSRGCETYAPYDRIVVTCGAPQIPPPLIDQLKDGGKMVIPLGQRYYQSLYVIEKKGKEIRKRHEGEVLFVPMLGEYGFKNAHNTD